MADPAQTPPATPPANDPNGGNNQQQAPPANDPGNNQQPPAQEFILNQEQFNQRFAEKMGAIGKELGLQPGGLKDFVAAQKAAKKPPAPTGETLSGADLKIARMEALMTAGVPSKQIPLLLQHLNISGKTREEIQASVGQLTELKLLTIEAPASQGNQQQQQQGPPNAAQGAGQTGVQGNGQGPKVWTKAEVLTLQKNPAEYAKHRDEILEQMSKGLIK